MFPLIFTGRMLLDTNCSCPTWTCVRRRVQALPSLWQANLGSCRGYTSCTFRRKFGVQCVAGVRHWADSYWLCFCATLQVMGGSCGHLKGIRWLIHQVQVLSHHQTSRSFGCLRSPQSCTLMQNMVPPKMDYVTSWNLCWYSDISPRNAELPRAPGTKYPTKVLYISQY